MCKRRGLLYAPRFGRSYRRDCNEHERVLHATLLTGNNPSAYQRLCFGGAFVPRGLPAWQAPSGNDLGENCAARNSRILTSVASCIFTTSRWSWWACCDGVRGGSSTPGHLCCCEWPPILVDWDVNRAILVYGRCRT